MNEEKKEWVEITEGELLSIVQDDLRAGAEKFTYNIKNKKLTRFQKLKGIEVGREMLKMAYNKLGSDYIETDMIVRGIKKVKKALKKGEIIDTSYLKDNFKLKMEETKYFKQKC